MGFFFVDPELYRKHRDAVLSMSQAIQINYPEHLSPEVRKPGFSDRQIAAKLGLEERVVREIRCVAEREYYPVDEWERALEFKDRACKGYAENGVAYATKKYIQKARAAKARSDKG
jgi:ribosome-binding protein aMBF1 (putative translation factor)